MESFEHALEIDTAECFEPLFEDVRYKGARGGRASAKSHFFAEMMVEECFMQHGTRAVCIREHQSSLRDSSKQLIEDKIKKLKLSASFHVTDTYIGTPGDGQILFRGMNGITADSIKSLEGARIAWVDEAQRLSRSSWDKLRPTIRTPGAQIWASWNPDQATDPVDEFFMVDPPRNSRCVTVTYKDNPWFPKDLREDLEYDRRRDPDLFDHIWGGGYNKKSAARVFKNWRIGRRDEFEFLEAMRDQHEPIYGGDFGFAVDPSVLLELYVVGNALFITREAYKVACEIDHHPNLFRPVMRRTDYPIIADSARPETISYLRRHGFPRIRGARKGPGSVEEGVAFAKRYDIIVHPDCVHAIDELRLYSYKVHPQTGLVLPVLQDKKNHVIDALRYALELLRRPRAGVR